MRYFLSKTEPDAYSIKQLEVDGRTVWDGVRNPQALKAIREMKADDRVFIYHSGGQSAVVGVARVASEPRPDPKDEKLTVVDYEYLSTLPAPVTLQEIKASHLFDDWALVRQGRLSTMPAPESFVEWIRKRSPGAKI